MKVRVLRAFFLKGERQEIGSEVEVDKATAIELVSMRKADYIDIPSVARGPLTVENAAGLVPGRKAKGGAE